MLRGMYDHDTNARSVDFEGRYGVPRDTVERVAHVLGDMTPGLPFGEAIGQRRAEILRVALEVTRAALDVDRAEDGRAATKPR